MEDLDNEVLGTSKAETEKLAINSEIILWSISALVLSILMVTFNNSAMVLGAGFLAKSFSIIVGTIIGSIGALAGNVLRKFARPDTIFTNGGFFQLIWVKVFWAIGPQVIGLFIGVALGSSLVLS
jgi:hypothetical protein